MAFSNILPAIAIALRKVGGEGAFLGSGTAEVGLFGSLRLRGIAAMVCRWEMNFLTTSLYFSCSRVEKMHEDDCVLHTRTYIESVIISLVQRKQSLKEFSQL